MTKAIAFVIGSLLVTGLGSAAHADQLRDYLQSQLKDMRKDARETKTSARHHRLDRRAFQLTRDTKGIEAAQKEAADRAQRAADAAEKGLEIGTLGVARRR